MTVLAIDIGGTKFAAALVDDDGTLHTRIEQPVGDSPTETLRHLVGRYTGADLDGVGIGSAGPIDVPLGEVSPVNILAWRDFPLVGAVRQILPGRPVHLAGDAQCMALGEWWRGGHRDPASAGSMLGIVVSTGIGGGLILDGRPYLGQTGNAGLIGHVIVERYGEYCPCGGRGCLETISSGPSMVRWAVDNGWAPTDPATPPDARTLAVEAAAGAALPLAAFHRAGEALATAIANTAAMIDLHHVVIGGGVAAAGDVLLDPLRKAAAEHAGPGALRAVTITATTLHRDAGLYGAAALALRDVA
jgi:predicted NBD/HSP70 family sugar kinase